MEVWAALCADQPIALETSEAVQYASRTRFNEMQNAVFLGADALAWGRGRRECATVHAGLSGP